MKEEPTKSKCLGCMSDSLTKKHDKDCTASPKNQRKLKPAEKLDMGPDYIGIEK